MDDGKKRRATLTKNPPPSALATRPSLRKLQSSNSISRNIHQRTGSNAYTSSNSSLERSNDSPISIDNYQSASYRSNQIPPTSEARANDLIGAPFDASSILSSIQSTSNGPTSAPDMRSDAPPLVHANTSPLLGMSQQQSTPAIPPGGQPMTEVTPPRSENGTLSPKRFSGEAQFIKPTAMRKKSGFSSFVNSMLGTPRTIKISAPENPMHMIHVGYDNVTGQFTVSTFPLFGSFRNLISV